MAQNLTASTLFFAIAGGFIPSLLWLWFWLKEDSHPEPRTNLIYTFIAGMIVVPIAMIFEYFTLFQAGLAGSFSLLIWAFIEETLKYGAARKMAFSRPVFDEPVDAIIYMVTAALGFASLENTLFIIKTFHNSGILSGLDIGNVRFIGATLLHTASSATVGAFMAFSLRKNRKNLKRNTYIGIVVAGLLHFAFNYLTIKSGGGNILKALIPLWLIIIVIIFVFEKVKKQY